MRRGLLLLAALVLLAAPAAATAAQKLTVNDAAQFPQRAFVLTPDRPLAIDAARARVTENGEPVPGATLESVGSREGSSAVVLVIDTSESMRGEPIARAIEAARGLAARRPPGQRLGVVLFSNTSRVRLAPTTDPERIEAALTDTPKLLGGTRIYDGVDLALKELVAAKVGTGSVVVLSDGNDTGSAVTARVLAARARRSGVRIFAVGLRSTQFDPTALRQLAASGRGRFLEAASAGELRGIFDALGASFAREYVLRYRSDASSRARVDVVLTAPGLPDGAIASYVTPAGATGAGGRSIDEDDFWARDGAIAIVALLAGLAVGIGALLLLGRRTHRRRDIGGRIAAFGMPVVESAPAQFGREPEKSLFDGLSWWAAFVEEVDIARMDRSPGELMRLGLAGGAAVGVLLAIISGGVVFVLLAAAGPFVVRAIVTRAADKQRAEFAEQLVDTLQGAGSALRAGHSVQSALAEVSEDAAEPTRRELGAALADERLGKPLDDALREVSRRLKNRDVEQIALVSQLQRTTGANMAEVLDRVADTVRERQDLQRTIKALTAQGRMARGVLTALPFGLLLALAVINPDYIAPLFSETAGIAVLIIAVVMTMAGSYAIKKIVAIEI